MSNKMLIDASHPEETRVVVVRGNKIEEFDFESEHKKQLKGNVYLARVTRVEPSLQAAFVEYGGNRHGFLAFSEIHPDYYQIPEADRKALLEAEARAARDDDDEEREEAPRRNRRGHNDRHERRGSGRHRQHNANRNSNAAPALPEPEFVGDFAVEAQERYAQAQIQVQDISVETEETVAVLAASTEQPVISEKPQHMPNNDDDDDDHDDEDDQVESVGAADDELEELPSANRTHRKHYKIQDVIKRRQIILVQVVKEERGNKGAALTTYLSLAGRYSVLMPNTARGGGISRKITNIQDRKRLKDIVKELEVPQGMGVILRTAGANRTKAEIRRDYEYLMRMWDNVRKLTMQSHAPALVYEEGNLIKRSIRDLYNKDITDILVAGEAGYREAKDFMRMLMPTHARVVQPYREATPIFARTGIEAQLDRMLNPQVTLKSGGYIIINQTEALVAIDVNSGRSTRENSIEETALQTNLEAAEEVARQLRLRDLAGLVVVDFIDMEEKRNNRAVEKRMKDCLKDDRARIQVGRISHFGLLEMSRQRIRASVLESTMQTCPHCAGTGLIRSDSSMALYVIRTIEEFLQRNSQNNIIVRAPVATALYVLNHKRHLLAEMESRFGLTIEIQVDETVGHQHLAIDKTTPAAGPVNPIPQTIQFMPYDEENDPEIIDIEDEAETENTASDDDKSRDDTNDDRKRNRRRRRRRGGRDKDETDASSDTNSDDDDSDENGDGEDNSALSEEDHRKKRRRGRRGGRKNRRGDYDNNSRLPAVEFVGFSRDEAFSRLNAYKAAQTKANTPVKAPVPAPEFVGFQPVLNKSVVAASSESASAFVKTEATEATAGKDKKAAKPNRRRAAKPRAAKEAVAETAEVVEVTAIAVEVSEPEAPIIETAVVNTEAFAPADQAEQPVVEEAPAKPARKKAASKATAKPARKPRAKKAVETVEEVEAAPKVVSAAEPVAQAAEPASKIETEAEIKTESEAATPRPSRRRSTTQAPSKPVVTSQVSQSDQPDEPAEQPKRGGWWQKKGFF